VALWRTIQASRYGDTQLCFLTSNNMVNRIVVHPKVQAELVPT
jgi:hypothetical protein